MQISRTAFPKVSLVGHPSDGYGGGVVGLTVGDFCATVHAKPSDKMRFSARHESGPIHDNPKAMKEFVRRYGYDDAVRLMSASLVRLTAYCETNGIAIAETACELDLDTTIPRQVGMGGSSAIVRATLDALCAFYDIAVPLTDSVTLAWEAETKELGIEAGLVDRVLQAYNGALHFRCEDGAQLWSTSPIEPKLLPKLFVAFRNDLAKVSSGGILSPVGERYRAGDPDVRATMLELRKLAQSAFDDLQAGRRDSFLRRIDAGMDCRKKLMPHIDKRYFELADIGHALGAHVTFTGSGGAVIGSYDSPAHLAVLEKAYGDVGATLIAVTPTQPRGSAEA